MTAQFPRLVLSNAPLPPAVQLALAGRSVADRRALVANPFLDDDTFARIFTRRLPAYPAGRALWRATLTPTQAAHAARTETRPNVLRVLVNSDVGRDGLARAAADGQLPAMSPTAAMLLMRRGGDTVGDAVAGQLAMPDAILWLMRRWDAVDLDHVADTLAASSRVKVTRRSWTPTELAAAVHERGALALPVLPTAARWPDHARMVAQAADLHAPEIAAVHGGATAAGMAILEQLRTIRSDHARQGAMRALAERADVPATVRQTALDRLAGDGRPTAPALPLELEVDWRRDRLTEEQVAALWRALDDVSPTRPDAPTWYWQAVSALRNPHLTGTRRELLGDVVAERATQRLFGGCVDEVRALAGGEDTHVLRPGLKWSPGGRKVAPRAKVIETYGRRRAAGPELPRDEVAAVAVPALSDRHMRTVGKLATTAFADDLECWETMLELGRSWTTSVAELLEASRVLAGERAA